MVGQSVPKCPQTAGSWRSTRRLQISILGIPTQCWTYTSTTGVTKTTTLVSERLGSGPSVQGCYGVSDLRRRSLRGLRLHRRQCRPWRHQLQHRRLRPRSCDADHRARQHRTTRPAWQLLASALHLRRRPLRGLHERCLELVPRGARLLRSHLRSRPDAGHHARPDPPSLRAPPLQRLLGSSDLRGRPLRRLRGRRPSADSGPALCTLQFRHPALGPGHRPDAERLLLRPGWPSQLPQSRAGALRRRALHRLRDSLLEPDCPVALRARSPMEGPGDRRHRGRQRGPRRQPRQQLGQPRRPSRATAAWSPSCPRRPTSSPAPAATSTTSTCAPATWPRPRPTASRPGRRAAAWPPWASRERPARRRARASTCVAPTSTRSSSGSSSTAPPARGERAPSRRDTCASSHRCCARRSGPRVAPSAATAAWRMDFNAWIASGADPTLVAGQPVYVQGWFRNSAGQGQLSDAVAFLIGP